MGKALSSVLSGLLPYPGFSEVNRTIRGFTFPVTGNQGIAELSGLSGRQKCHITQPSACFWLFPCQYVLTELEVMGWIVASCVYISLPLSFLVIMNISYAQGCLGWPVKSPLPFACFCALWDQIPQHRSPQWRSLLLCKHFSQQRASITTKSQLFLITQSGAYLSVPEW